MSMITRYARLTGPQLQELKESPAVLMRTHDNAPPGCDVVDLDKAAGLIAWLLSPCKRAEQVQFAALINEDLGEEPPLSSDPQPIPPLDDFAICIEGRGPKKIEALDAGYGPACEFQPEEVKAYSEILDTVDEGILRRELNFELMDTLHLPVGYWREEGEEMFIQYVVPQFEKLTRFYKAAANANQAVVVWYS